jgi:hypothetical protein
VCLKRKAWLQGLICANLSWAVGGFGPCQQMWGVPCHVSNPEIIFNMGKLEEMEAAKESDEREVPIITFKRYHQKIRKRKLAALTIELLRDFIVTKVFPG